MNGELPPIDPEEQNLINRLEESSAIPLNVVIPMPGQTGDLPVGTRQILEIKSFALLNSNWKVSDDDPTVSSQAYILLTGAPTPSSEVEKAYLRFVDMAKIKRPIYSKSQKRIDLYVNVQSIPLILKQLKQDHRYIWIGHFHGGQIYGDIHTWS